MYLLFIMETDKKDKTDSVNVDHYFNEQGLMVFTAAYHLKRGYCCQSDCKHCPYNEEKRKKRF